LTGSPTGKRRPATHPKFDPLREAGHFTSGYAQRRPHPLFQGNRGTTGTGIDPLFQGNRGTTGTGIVWLRLTTQCDTSSRYVVEGDHFSLLSAHNATAIAEKIQLLLMPSKA
jgi:hypothetical protein